MKKIIIFFILILSFGLLSACGGVGKSTEPAESPSKGENNSSEEEPGSSQSPTETDKTNWNDDGVLKILTIGNSFSDDSMEYVAEIALAAGVKEVKLGNLFVASCSLTMHANNARSDAAAYEYRINSGAGWSTTYGYKMSDAIKSENWDYISLQQASGSSGLPSTYGASLNYMIDYVKKNAESGSKLVWNMTWAYQQNSAHEDFSRYNRDQITMYNAIVEAVQDKVETRSEFSLVIPTGTAIQNARTSYVGDNLTRDGFHLTMDFGRYIAGLTFVGKLTGLSLDRVNFVPGGVSASYKKIAVESVDNAIEKPYTITPSSFSEK